MSVNKKRRRRPAIPILLHDAPMSDHLSVGVQTWGSAILLGREMALHPQDFGLFPSANSSSYDHISPAMTSSCEQPGKSRVKGTRVLELGAGTGLLSILCRKLLDLYHATHSSDSNYCSETTKNTASEVIATDFLRSVLDNLKICIDLNFPPLSNSVEIAKLDWKTFPRYMRARHGLDANLDVVAQGKRLGRENRDEDGLDVMSIASGHGRADQEHHEEEYSLFTGEAYDLVLASDCVYDPTHAKMLREVGSWVLRLPSEDGSDPGGTFVCRRV